MSNFDVEKFRKVHALIGKGATQGERDAAQAKAETLARKAGLTFEDAMSKLRAYSSGNTSGSIFAGFDDWMEEKEPGYKAQRAAEREAREQRWADRRSEILAEFGTVKAFFDPTPAERLIAEAVRPFVAEWYTYQDVCGTSRTTASKLGGVTGTFFHLKDVSDDVVEAVKGAIPFPRTVRDTFEELRVWDKLNRDRALFFDIHEYYFDLPTEMRTELLRQQMRELPVTCWDDLDARFHFKAYDWQQQWIDEQEFEDPEWSRLFADVQLLRAMSQAPAQNGHRTNADKRRDVLSMLDASPELSDREIARRVGVSPQTVGNCRRRVA